MGSSAVEPSNQCCRRFASFSFSIRSDSESGVEAPEVYSCVRFLALFSAFVIQHAEYPSREL